MIFSYGVSLKGKSHQKSGVECQDSHRILRMDDGRIIAAIADGVGSADNSAIGSRIAVETVVQFCKEYMPVDNDPISIKSMMRTAFNYAFKKIVEESESSRRPIESFDTTLSVVIYDGSRIVYGHSGDGAIIGLNEYGNFVEITRPLKGADGFTVLPLRSGYANWMIDTYDENLVSILMVTDGMLATICPYLLRDMDNYANRAYVPLGSFFVDPHGVPGGKNERKKTKRAIEEFMVGSENYNSDDFYDRLLKIYRKHIPDQAEEVIEDLKKDNYPVVMMQNEQDDKTVVGIINTSLELDDNEPEYYADLDWEKLQEAWNRKAYPHMYPQDESAANAEDDDYSYERDRKRSKKRTIIGIIKFLATVALTALIIFGVMYFTEQGFFEKRYKDSNSTSTEESLNELLDECNIKI
ncbi:protein phosphatase 2C domain-containing protein [Eubacterium uniforme]|uniref:Protein phosphatase 2C n=1 Tax=Eubacterium uniforme TaxID=39495 RepID=A0A1T4VA56_9FIRM|nr:protein phosphatase 2C domain-containing protein [Eubacterium uniforme]SKA61809.1 Protein phosphatase 2C [Eubacterium uniforme]HAH18079.1 hypothetical protein [Eubacterium sp.]HAV90580.1 hypothetical protein [Eubacterium sp.]